VTASSTILIPRFRLLLLVLLLVSVAGTEFEDALPTRAEVTIPVCELEALEPADDDVGALVAIIPPVLGANTLV
jgi:hypothetical protein